MHIDTNYIVGAIGSGGGRRHFAQHAVSGSMSVALTGQWSAYFEGFGISRQEAGGRAMTGHRHRGDLHDRDAAWRSTAESRRASAAMRRRSPRSAAFPWRSGTRTAGGAGAHTRVTRAGSYISFSGPRSRFRSSAVRPNFLPISWTVSSSFISARPTASASLRVSVFCPIRRIA